ncbi:hypothetical protein [Duganella hordei]|uniref:hypothetical protein n=1 Tax=Duganella hordei TaxID=2865934 RepID=UPI003342C275
MTITDFFTASIGWIEAHEHTVDLFKWIVAGLAAWLLGVFRAIRAWALRPSISITETYSHCFTEQHAELDTYSDVTLFAFVLDAVVMNPTTSKVGVQTFELEIRRRGLWKRWTSPITAIGFPTMPRTPMPNDAIKVVPIWLTTFEGYDSSLSLRDIDGQNSAAGLIFFALVMPDSSIVSDEKCTLKLSVRLATGERRSVVTKIKFENGLDKLERMVPSSIKYVRHKSVWRHRA